MARVSCIGLYKPYTNLPFGVCAMYFYPQVNKWLITMVSFRLLGRVVPIPNGLHKWLYMAVTKYVLTLMILQEGIFRPKTWLFSKAG